MSKNFCSLNDETCVYNQLEECKCEHDCEHKMDSKKPSYRELEQQNADLLEVLKSINQELKHDAYREKVVYAEVKRVIQQTLAKLGGDES